MNPNEGDQLQQLYLDRKDAEWALRQAEKLTQDCRARALRAELRYRRQALWIKADELRRELQKTEMAAAAIHIPKEDE